MFNKVEGNMHELPFFVCSSYLLAIVLNVDKYVPDKMNKGMTNMKTL